MSTWHVRAIERIGTPQPWWASIMGPTAEDAAALRTLDLTVDLLPLKALSQRLERDLTKASLGNLSLDLVDPDGSVAEALGPASATLATADRYASPWIEVSERWDGGASSAVRFLGYADPESIEWDEEGGTTRVSVYHASQLLRERKLKDMPSILRPWPSVPTTSGDVFQASNADTLMDVEFPAYVPRGNAAALESALWAAGKISWAVEIYSQLEKELILGKWRTTLDETYAPPTPPALTLTVDGTPFSVSGTEWDMSFLWELSGGDSQWYWKTVWRVTRVVLSGAPDLTSLLQAGDYCQWGVAEETRTHYLLAEAVPEPPSGTEGQRWMRLTTVDQLVAGDTLAITTVVDGQRQDTECKVLDLDGEKNIAYVLEPLDAMALPGPRIRRNSRDPVLVDGLALAQQAVAPFLVDTGQLLPAATGRPILTWLPLTGPTPSLYGLVDLQPIDRAGGLRAVRRGGIDSLGKSTGAGIWEGTATAWSWLGLPRAQAPVERLGDLNQWPGGSNTTAPPVVHLDGDLSGGATIPPNGWRRLARSWKALDTALLEPEVWWDGTEVQWASHAAAGQIPTRMVHFSAQTVAPGRYTRTSAGAWTFAAHSGPGTLGADGSITPTGTLPGGNWIALGLGAWSNAGTHEEALLALSVATTTGPWNAATACLLSCGAGGALTVQATEALSTPQPAVWSVAGGLVLATWTETRGGGSYPRTRLWRIDGGTPVTVDLLTLEVLPGGVQPLSLAASRIGGWWALALETYQDDDGRALRRARLLQLDADLRLRNGVPELDPADPLMRASDFSRGDLVADPMPAGSILGRLVRTGQGDTMVGLLGGRIFQVDMEISRVIERVAIGDLDALGLLEQVGAALLATAIPRPDGGIELVSRRAGTLRTLPAASEGAANVRPAGQWISTVTVRYEGGEVTAQAARAGGQKLELDLSPVLRGYAQSAAVAEAAATHWGTPAPVRTLRWSDPAQGEAASLAPAFWASWRVGDRVVAGGRIWKLHQLDPDPEAREAKVELVDLEAAP